MDAAFRSIPTLTDDPILWLPSTKFCPTGMMSVLIAARARVFQRMDSEWIGTKVI